MTGSPVNRRTASPGDGPSQFVWDASEQYGFWHNYGQVISGNNDLSGISRQPGGGIVDWTWTNNRIAQWDRFRAVEDAINGGLASEHGGTYNPNTGVSTSFNNENDALGYAWAYHSLTGTTAVLAHSGVSNSGRSLEQYKVDGQYIQRGADGQTYVPYTNVPISAAELAGDVFTSTSGGLGFGDYWGMGLTLMSASSYNMGIEMAKWAPIKDGWGNVVVKGGTNYKPMVVNAGIVLRGLGAAGGIASGLYTISQMSNGNISAKEGWTDLTFTGVSFMGVPGLVIGGGYTGVKSYVNWSIGNYMGRGMSRSQAEEYFWDGYTNGLRHGSKVDETMFDW